MVQAELFSAVTRCSVVIGWRQYGPLGSAYPVVIAPYTGLNGFSYLFFSLLNAIRQG